MWDFSFAIPTLLILCIIMAAFFSLPRLRIRRNTFFVELIIIETITIITDITSSYVDMYFLSFPLWFVHLNNVIYFVAFFCRASALNRFNAVVTGLDTKSSRFRKYLIRTPFFICVILALLSPFLEIIYYIDDSGYHVGRFYNVLYICALFYVFLSFYAVFRYGRHLVRRRERYSMCLYNAIILAGIIARYLLPRYLLMDTFVLMAIILVYLAFENPEYYLELRSVVFNNRALREYLEEKAGKLNRRCIGVVIRRYYEMRDIYGAPQMDAGLNIIGRYLKTVVPKGIVFYCRRGRFVIICEEDMDHEMIIKTITERFKKAWKSSEVEIFVDVRYAMIELSDCVETVDVILNTMAKAMYDAESSESDITIEVTEKELLQTEREMIIKRTLENAIENNSVELFLQPLINAATGQIIGAESLARLRDSKGNIIPPAKFISIAENSGRINELGEQIFEKTCKFIKETDLKNMGVEWVNVNLSPVQFMRKDLAERYSSIIKKYGISPDMIHLEITEESLIDEYFMKKQISAMGEKGFKFVLDDYGTGYSNLARLKKCPFINIKLDMSLVWDYYKDPDQILPTMIRAFKQMGFGITSEGVEDNGMADMMKEIGCDYLQGYYYSKPIPLDEFVERYSK